MKIGFIGGGNMGEAILSAILREKLASTIDVSVSDVAEARRNYLAQKYGVATTPENKQTILNKDVIVLAIKPQNLATCPGLKGLIN
jgi:pyrroline-5-carboxylate reductase